MPPDNGKSIPSTQEASLNTAQEKLARMEPVIPTVLLVSFLPPYRVLLMQALRARVGSLTILLSTPMEPNRPWSAEWADLDVQVQKTITINRTWHHPRGFSERLYVHFPYNTYSLLRKLHPKVIISGELGLRTIQAMLYHLLNPGTRIIIWASLSEHTEHGRGWLRNLLRHWLLKHTDAVLVHGESGARYIRRFGVPDSRIFRVLQTTYLEKFSCLPERRDGIQAHRLLYMGQLNQRKGLAGFISILAQWARNHPERMVEFWLVGDGPERKSLEDTARPANLQLKFFGNVGYDELPKYYSECGILVFPTLADSWGLVVTEGMAASLPILGSLYAQAVEETVDAAITGWVFHPDNPEEARSALERALATTPAKLDEMRKEARRKALQCTPEAVAEQILRAVDYVVH